MRATFSLGLLLVIVVSICDGFMIPSPGIVRPSTRLLATQDEILAAYQQRIKVVKPGRIKAPPIDEPAPVVETPPVVDTPPPVVYTTAPVVDTPPPVVETPPPVIDTPPPVLETPPPAIDTPPPVLDTPPPIIDTAPIADTSPVTTTTPATPGTDPLSTMWRQLTEPFKSMPDPFEPIKIPKDPFKDVDIDLKALSMPDLKESFESLKSMSVSDIKESIKSVDLKTVTESVKNIQLPTPPERPEGTGVILPDGGRLPTLLELWNNGPFAESMPGSFSQWKESIAVTTPNNEGKLASWFPVIWDALRVAEFGAWYVAGLCLVAWQAQVSYKERQFEEELRTAELKAKQAAEVAALAAQGATVAKKLATAVAEKSKTSASTKSTEALLTDSKMHAIELEKQAMKKKLESLQQETEQLKKQLKAATGSAADANGAVEAPVAAPKRAPKKVEPRDPKEDERLLQIIKEQDLANASAATATKPKKKAAKKRAEKKVSKKKVVAKKAEKVVVVEMEEKVVPTEPKDVFFANTTAPATEKPKKEKAAAPKNEPAAAPKNEAVVSHSSDNPWSSLSETTLKRKTIKELTDYLSERVRSVLRSCAVCRVCSTY